MKRRRAQAASGGQSRAPAQTELSLAAPPERLLALLRVHDRLMRAVAARKKSLSALTAKIEDVARRMTEAWPIADECRHLDEEIHALFAELLARKRQPRETRQLVSALHHMLQEAGVLSPRPTRGRTGEAADFSDRHETPFADASRDAEAAAGAEAPFGAGGYSARRPTNEPANQSVRGLFRDLAMALHPDKVPDEAEKARRTEVMKELSRAYEEGDLARLLELKRIWLSAGQVAAASEDEVARRCATLAQTNAALCRQLKDLDAELRELRRSPPARMLKDLRKAKDPTGQDPVAVMIAQAKEERDRAVALRDFVSAYRDGRISLDELIKGPPSMRDQGPYAGNDADGDFDEEGFTAFLNDIFGDSPSPGRGRRRRARRRPGHSQRGPAPSF